MCLLEKNSFKWEKKGLLVWNFFSESLIGFLLVFGKGLGAFFHDPLLPREVLIMKQKWFGSHFFFDIYCQFFSFKTLPKYLLI